MTVQADIKRELSHTKGLLTKVINSKKWYLENTKKINKELREKNRKLLEALADKNDEIRLLKAELLNYEINQLIFETD